MTKIYLATPFSHKWFFIRWWRFLKVTKQAAQLMKQGYIVFSPITHSFLIAWFLPSHLMQAHTFWMNQDLSMVEWCDEFWVYAQGHDAWQKSRGACKELETATELGKKIRFIAS